MLSWLKGNLSVEKDAADNWKPSKKLSPERIDGIVAFIMAVGRAALQQGNSLPTMTRLTGRCPYEDVDLVAIAVIFFGAVLVVVDESF